ncbi:HAMP domain-containing sensor histidine kinase [Lachnospiraceae bacterium JLR.KK008]
MKLWKKLSLMTSILVLLTSGFSGGILIWHSVHYNEEKTVENYRQQVQSTALALGRELDKSGMERYSDVTRRAYLIYLIRKYGADQYILLCNQEEVCNLTPYTMRDPDADRWKGLEPVNYIQKTGNRYLLLSGKSVPSSIMKNYSLVLVADISDVYEETRLQTVLVAVLYLGSALFAVLLTFAITKKILAPLQDLRQAAEGICEGNLAQRARADARDEIGIVAGAFNEMADRIEEQVTQLSEISEQRRQMLGSLAHEIKTPMTAIIGYSDTLLHVNVREEQRRRALTHIYKESRRLERLSSKLMNLTGLYDNDSIYLEQTDLPALLARVEELESYHLAQKSICLQTTCGMETIMADGDLFESLLVNLIDNGIKASRRGGTVYVTAQGGRISVRDEGCGIPQDELKRVTEAFYMADKSRSRAEGGCGLGLFLCSRIAALHQAELVIESEVGKGTTVSVVFCR